MYTLPADLQAFDKAWQVYRFGEFVHVTSRKDAVETQRSLEKYLSEKGYKQIVVEPVKPVIEDCFLALMNKTENA